MNSGRVKILPHQNSFAFHISVGEKGHLGVTLYFSQKYFYSIPKIFYNIYQIFSKNILLKSSCQFGVKIEVLISFVLKDLLKK